MGSWRWCFGLVLLCSACLSPCVGQEKGKKPADDDTEVFSTSEIDGDKWTYSVTYWKKGRLLVTVFQFGPVGKDLRPAVMTVSRLKTGRIGGVAAAQKNEAIDIRVPVGDDTYFRYQFKEGKHDFQPDFLKKSYPLREGALFVIDHGPSPAKVEQIKADLGKLFSGKGELKQKALEAALKRLREDKTAVEAILKRIEAK